MSQADEPEANSGNKRKRLANKAGTVWEKTRSTGQLFYNHATGQAKQLGDQYQNSRAREYVEAVLKQTGQGLDTISGKAMYELVRDRLDLQDRYNDLLAMKLQEAMDRLDVLEERLAKRDCEASSDNDG